MNITPPIVHLNGTSRKELAEGYDNAHEALRVFMQAWGKITCNSRDYYCHPEGMAAWDRAIAHREEMGQKIRELNDYLRAHREHLFEP